MDELFASSADTRVDETCHEKEEQQHKLYIAI